MYIKNNTKLPDATIKAIADWCIALTGANRTQIAYISVNTRKQNRCTGLCVYSYRHRVSVTVHESAAAEPMAMLAQMVDSLVPVLCHELAHSALYCQARETGALAKHVYGRRKMWGEENARWFERKAMSLLHCHRQTLIDSWHSGHKAPPSTLTFKAIQCPTPHC